MFEVHRSGQSSSWSFYVTNPSTGGRIKSNNQPESVLPSVCQSVSQSVSKSTSMTGLLSIFVPLNRKYLSAIQTLIPGEGTPLQWPIRGSYAQNGYLFGAYFRYMKGVGKSVISVYKQSKLTDALWLWKSVENVLFLSFNYAYLKDTAFTAVKRDAKF